MKKKWMRKIPFVIGFAILGLTVVSGAVMMLWNGILAPVFHIGMLSFWQALGILALARLLFGGMGRRHGMMGCGGRKRMMMMKWQALSPEEREQFMTKMQAGGCGPWRNKESNMAV